MPSSVSDPSVDAELRAGVAPRQRLPRNVYPLRVLGTGLGGVLVASVLYERQAPMLHWLVWFGCIVLWPHLAYLVASRSKQPFEAENATC